MSHKKRILYLVPSTGFGGAETFLQQTAKFHDTEKVEPVYLCFRAGPLTESLKNQNKKVFVLSAPPRLRNPLSIWKTTREILRITMDYNVDIIHSTMAYSALFGGLITMLSRVPHVWFQHGPVTGWMDRIASYLPAKKVFVNSSHTEALQLKFNPRQKTEKIILGVDIDCALSEATGPEIRNAWGISDDTFLLGNISRPQPQKGLEDFVRAVSLLSQRHNRPVRGIIIGANQVPSLYEEKIQALIDSLGAPVSLLPAEANAVSKMAAFDLIVSTAVQPEAFGLTVVESMSMGVPIVAPNEGGPKDILNEGSAGSLFEARNLTNLVETLDSIMNLSPADRKEIGLRGKALVQDSYLAKNSILQMEAAYERILTSSN